MRIPPRAAGVALLAGALAACSDSAAPGTGTQVTFHLVGSQTPGAVLGSALLSDTLVGPNGTLVLDTVQLVLRDIRFQRVNEDQCDGELDDDHDDDVVAPAALRHDDDDDDDGDDGDSDACESFNAGPFLLDVPLGPEIDKVFSVAVDTGTFDRLRIKIHKPEDDGDDPKDSAFLGAHPEFLRVSVRAVGSFDGTPFVFTSDIEAEQRMDLVPPLVVADSVTNVDVTIKVDARNWFTDGAGGLVDPATAGKGGPNDNLVRDNIKRSFRAFRDDDCDGEDDDDHGSDD